MVPATFAGQVSLADIVALMPQCAISCLVTAVSQSNCSVTDLGCLCTNLPLQHSATACIAQSCTILESLAAKSHTELACNSPVRDRHKAFEAVSNTSGALSGIFVLLRLGFKLFVALPTINRRRFPNYEVLTLDDWLILATIFVRVPSSIINVYGLNANGLGRDVWTLTPSQITRFGRFFYADEALYCACVALLKLSLLAFYLRIFPTHRTRRLLWVTFGITILYGAVFILIALFQCYPVSYYWTKWDGQHEGSCMDTNSVAWSNAAVSIALDVWMVAIPLAQLKGLNMQWRKKVAVGLMFGVGTFVTIVSILRLSSIVTFTSSDNPTWDDYNVTVWSTVEINIGIICACMPAMRLIVTHVLPNRTQSRKTMDNAIEVTRTVDVELARSGGSIGNTSLVATRAWS